MCGGGGGGKGGEQEGEEEDCLCSFQILFSYLVSFKFYRQLFG